MKKFFVPLLLAMALLLPTAITEAAYVLVPNFRDITSNRIEERIRFLGMDQKSHNGVNYTRWNYECVDGKTSDYVNKYINKCKSQRDLQLVGQSSGNWYFVYTGGQAKFLTKINGEFHMHVRRSGDSVVVNLVGGMYPK